MLLPPCPLRLRSSFVWKYQLGGLVLVAVGLVAVVGYAWWQIGTVRELLDQSQIWKDGVTAPARVTGRISTSKFIFHSYKLDVSYVDAARKRHEAKLEFDTLVGEVDRNRDPVVHYVKEAPERFALSWAMDVTASRWSSIVFMAVVGVGLIGGSFAGLGIMALKRLADARRCAARSDEIIVHITKVEPQIVKGSHTGNVFHFSGQAPGGRPVTGKTAFTIKEEPLYADDTKQTMVALVPQENLKRVVVLRRDFHPFALSADQEAKVRAEIAQRSAATS